jgi:peptide/nickel transport system permease protein
VVAGAAGEALRKAAVYVLVAWVALTLNFLLPRLAPGDPLNYLLGQEADNLPQEKRDVVARQFGLDQPLTTQYVNYFTGAVRGDLGTSVRTGKPVTDTLLEPLRWSLLLIVPAVLLSTVLGVFFGALSAWWRGRAADYGLLTGMLTLESMPGFWVGLILLSVFVAQLGWFPSFGIMSLRQDLPWYQDWWETLKRLVLPVATITLVSTGNVYLLTRATMLTTLGEDYLMMAEAKGVGPGRLVFRHALRNALLPVHTHFVLSMGLVLSGAVVVETVFSYPGLGSTIYQSVLARDYPLLQGAFLLTTFGVIAANLIADLTYPLIDPRARRPAGAV